METKDAIARLLKLVMLVLAAWWLLLWWLFPTQKFAVVVEPMYHRMTNQAFGEASEYS